MQWLVGLLLPSFIKALLDWLKEQYNLTLEKYRKQQGIKKEETGKAAKDTQPLKDVKDSDDGDKIDKAIDDALDHF